MPTYVVKLHLTTPQDEEKVDTFRVEAESAIAARCFAEENHVPHSDHYKKCRVEVLTPHVGPEDE